jgi:hypothetical protein
MKPWNPSPFAVEIIKRIDAIDSPRFIGPFNQYLDIGASMAVNLDTEYGVRVFLIASSTSSDGIYTLTRSTDKREVKEAIGRMLARALASLKGAPA